MVEQSASGTPVAWHQALVVAVTGERRSSLGLQVEPDLEVVVAELGGGPVRVQAVPADLLVGIGPARFAAVLTDLRRRLADGTARPVVTDRPPDPDERRLLAEVPPHH